MNQYEDDLLYGETNSVNNAEVDSRRLILYDYPVTLNQNGIYNILENIGCPPTNILLMDYKMENSCSNSSPSADNDDQGTSKDQSLSYVVSSQTGSWAVVEFASRDHVNKAFYVLTTKHRKYMDAQYAYCCR